MSSGARQTHRATPQPRHGRVGLVSPASFNRGLWARLLMWTMTSFALVSMIPEVSTNFRNNRAGPTRTKPFSRSANLRYRRSASTVSVRSKSTFSRRQFQGY